MRTVIVRNYHAEQPVEIGRATLQPDGTAKVSGFSADERANYEQMGLRNYHEPPDADGDRPRVKPTDGEQFLDALARSFIGGAFVRAEDVDA